MIHTGPALVYFIRRNYETKLLQRLLLPVFFVAAAVLRPFPYNMSPRDLTPSTTSLLGNLLIFHTKGFSSPA